MPNIVVFTDEPVLAEGCRAVLSSMPGTVVRIEEQLSRLADPAERPDLLLLRVTSAVTFDVLEELLRKTSGTAIVLWSDAISTELLRQAVRMGVRGLLRRAPSPAMLVQCIESVLTEGWWFDPIFSARVLAAKMIKLTPRESDLVRLVAHGLRNKEIADELSLGCGTIRVYLSRLFQKLGVKDRFELALHGLRNMSASAPEPVMSDSLTRRERDVVSLVYEGLKNKEIARRLELSEGTIKVYLNRAFRKTGVNGRNELLRNCVRGPNHSEPPVAPGTETVWGSAAGGRLEWLAFSSDGPRSGGSCVRSTVRS